MLYRKVREDDLPEGSFDSFHSPNPSPEKIAIFKQMLSQLSLEAKIVVNIVLNTPSSFWAAIGGPTPLSQTKIINYLITERKWTTTKARLACKEIRSKLFDIQ